MTFSTIKKDLFLTEISNEILTKYNSVFGRDILKIVYNSFYNNTVEPTRRLIDVGVFVESCCVCLDLLVTEVKSRSRKRELVYARQAITYFLINSYKLKQEDICKHFNHDRSTTSHSNKVAKNFIKSNDAMFMQYYNICKDCLYE